EARSGPRRRDLRRRQPRASDQRVRGARSEAVGRRHRLGRQDAGAAHGRRAAQPARKAAGGRGRRARDRADACARARERRAPRHAAARVEASPMIGRLRGTLLAKQPPALVVDVNGVGYELEAPMSTFFDLPETGREVALFTHYAVKEDTAVLYGFL